MKPSSYLNDSICQGSSLPVSRLRYWIGSMHTCCRPVCKTMFTMYGLNTSGLALRPEMNSEIKVRSRATLSRLPVAGGICCCCATCSGVASCGVAPATVGPTRAAAQTAANAAVPPPAAMRRKDLRLITGFDVVRCSMDNVPRLELASASLSGPPAETAHDRSAARALSSATPTTPERIYSWRMLELVDRLRTRVAPGA